MDNCIDRTQAPGRIQKGNQVAETTKLLQFSKQISVSRQRLENITERLAIVINRLVGDHNNQASIGQDLPEESPGEYNIINYDIHRLHGAVDDMESIVQRAEESL